VPCYSVENGLAEGAFSPLCRKFLKLVKISPSCRSNFIRVYEWAKSENRTSADDDILFWEKPEPQSCTRKNKSLGGRAVLFVQRPPKNLLSEAFGSPDPT
jgi:hypothetical protein